MGQSQKLLLAMRESETFKGVDLSQDPCGSGCESGPSEGVDLSQVLCRSGHTQVWDLQGRKSESQRPPQEQIQTRDIYRNRSEPAT